MSTNRCLISYQVGEREQTPFKAIERVMVLELEQRESNQSRPEVTTRTIGGQVRYENLEGLGEQAPSNNAEDDTCNSRRYRVEAKKVILKYLNSPEGTGKTHILVHAYLCEDVSWIVSFVEKVGLCITLPSRVRSPSKHWNSQSDSSRNVNRNPWRRKRHSILRRSLNKNTSATKRKVVDRTFIVDLSAPLSIGGELWVKTKCVTPIYVWMYGDFSSEEVSKAMGDTSKVSVLMVDGLDLSAIKNLNMKNISVVFSYWCTHVISEKVEVWRTILLPKDGNRSDVNNWWPIMIGNLLMNLYVRVWRWRLISNVDIKSCQKGFVHTDRFYSNVKVLQQVICTRQWNGKEVNIVFLDLEKALETVVPYWHKKCPERLWKECSKCMVTLSSIHK